MEAEYVALSQSCKDLFPLLDQMRAPEEGEQFHYHSGGPLHKTGSQNLGPT
jgi:hypothetical protein